MASPDRNIEKGLRTLAASPGKRRAERLATLATIMTSPAKILTFVASCVCLVALVFFIIYATHFSLLIVLPAVASAGYLAFLIGHWATLN